MNARYYGHRAGKYEGYAKLLFATAALFSAAALALILGFDPTAITRDVAASLSGLAAVISGVAPFLGLTEKIRDLRNQLFAYSQLFGQLEFVITEIKRAHTLSPEHVGLARMVIEAYTRIEALDELDPDEKLLDQKTAKVRKAFPVDYLWTHF